MINFNIHLLFSLFVLSQLVLILYFKQLAVFFNLYDEPDKIRKKHLIKTSLLGGSIIFLSLVFTCIVFLFDNSFIETNSIFFKTNRNYLFFLISCAFMFGIGFADDKYNLGYFTKLSLTAIVIVFLIFLDQSISIDRIQFSFYQEVVNISIINLFFTTMCFLLFINAINMFDGIDGQVGLYSVFILFLILSLIGFNYFITFILISFLTFLYLNLKRKCFLGDNGTILIGFIFSYLMIKLYNQNIIYFADKIFLIMIIPGLDMLRLFAQRLVNKKNPFKGDSNHIHHLFVNQFGKYKSIFYIQLLIITPVILSFYFNLLMINFITAIVYFITIIILNSAKVN